MHKKGISIECDNTRAMVVRAIMYEKGLGGEINIDETRTAFEFSSRSGFFMTRHCSSPAYMHTLSGYGTSNSD